MEVLHSQAGECLIVVLGLAGRVFIGPAEGDLGSPQRPPEMSYGIPEGRVLLPPLPPRMLECDDFKLIIHRDRHVNLCVTKMTSCCFEDY